MNGSMGERMGWFGRTMYFFLDLPFNLINLALTPVAWLLVAITTILSILWWPVGKLLPIAWWPVDKVLAACWWLILCFGLLIGHVLAFCWLRGHDTTTWVFPATDEYPKGYKATRCWRCDRIWHEFG